MEIKQVTIIAERQYHEWYRSLYPDNKLVSIVAFRDRGQVLNESRSEVIILDCDINVQNGLKLLRVIKSLHTATPIIFITGISSEDIAIEAFRIGAKEFIRKPVVMEELKECIEFLLSLKKLSQGKRKPLSSHISGLIKTRGSEEAYKLPRNILNVVRFIEKNISKEIDLETLASEASVSKYHFCKMFKKHFGMSPMKYIMGKRIEIAKRLLPRGNCNISSVAYEVGFRDLSSFNKQFKRQTGITPSLFKAAVRNKAT